MFSTRRPGANHFINTSMFLGCRLSEFSGSFKAKEFVLGTKCTLELSSDHGLTFRPQDYHYFCSADPEINHPDIQFHFLPSQVIDHGRTLPKEEAFQAHVGTLRAKSFGSLKLKSNNPRDHPIIDPRFVTYFNSYSAYSDTSRIQLICPIS